MRLMEQELYRSWRAIYIQMFRLGLGVPKRNQTAGKNCRSPERKSLWIQTGQGEPAPAWANLSPHLPFPRSKVGSRDRRAVVQGNASGVEWWPSGAGRQCGQLGLFRGWGGSLKSMGAFLKQTPMTPSRYFWKKSELNLPGSRDIQITNESAL